MIAFLKASKKRRKHYFLLPFVLFLFFSFSSLNGQTSGKRHGKGFIATQPQRCTLDTEFRGRGAKKTEF